MSAMLQGATKVQVSSKMVVTAKVMIAFRKVASTADKAVLHSKMKDGLPGNYVGPSSSVRRKATVAPKAEPAGKKLRVRRYLQCTRESTLCEEVNAGWG